MPTLKELVEQLPPDLQEEAKDFVEVMKMSSIIDTPAFTGGVLFSQFKLRLSCLFLALHRHIVANDPFVDANGGSEEAGSPYALFIPIHLLEKSEFLGEMPTGVLLDGFDNPAHRITGWDHHIQVDVVRGYSHLDEFPIRIMGSDLEKFHLQVFPHSPYQDLSAEAGHPHNMVLGYIY